MIAWRSSTTKRGSGLLLVSMLVLASCSGGTQTSPTETAGSPAGSPPPDAEIAAFLTNQALGDRGTTDLMHDGFLRGVDEFGFQEPPIVIELQQVAEYESQVRAVSEEGATLVVNTNPPMVDPVKAVAPDFPDVHYVIINGVVDPPLDNVMSVIAQEQEGTFVTGALAALMSETGKIGFISGLDIDVIRRYESGYLQGALYINPDIEITEAFADSFEDPAKGKEIALDMYSRGIDVIFVPAGATNNGVIEASVETGKWVIGAEGDYREAAPDTAIASFAANLDNMVYEGMKAHATGEWEGGVRVLTFQEGAVTTKFFNEDLVPADVLERLDEISQMVLDGEITVEPESFVVEWRER